MRTLAVGVVVVALGAAVTAQRPLQAPTAAQGAMGLRSARQICQQQVEVLRQQQRVFQAMRDDRMSVEATTVLATAVIMQQAVIDALMRDARAQDPSFRCFGWDFTPPAARED